MADDINKNITIQVTAQTTQLEQSITNLSKIIDSLLTQQKQLTDAGNQNSAAFQNNAAKIAVYQKSIQDASTQLNSYVSILNAASTAVQKNQALIAALTAVKDKYSKTVGASSKQVQALNSAINTLISAAQKQQVQTNQTQAAVEANNKSLADGANQATNLQSGINLVNASLQQQQKVVDDNKSSFDAHKQVMDSLKTSFDEIKNVSGEFGPSLQDAAKGFNLMKSGLAVVKDGLYGIGDAMKADGFDFLLQILQQIFTAFISTTEGTQILKGAISAIGVVVNKVKAFFSEFMDGIINAVSHPIDSIKELGRMVEQNIINRFTAFATILDGLIHLDFKKVADGAIQAVTGVTNATDKIVSLGKAAINTGKEMVTSFTENVNKVDQTVDKHAKKLNDLTEKQNGYLSNNTKNSKNPQGGTNSSSQPTLSSSEKSAELPKGDPNADNADIMEADKLFQQQRADQEETIRKQTAQKVADDEAAVTAEAKKKEDAERKARNQQIVAEAKQAATQIASDALNTLSQSIQQQAQAKISALEGQKQSELSNTSLTGAQKLAIQANFKKQEDKVKAKTFKEEQELNIAKTLMSAALAEINLWADPGFPGAIAATVILAAETAAQIAQIASQKPPAYASGGLHYASDGRGGVLPGYSRADNTNAYLRSGEGIVVSEAMRDPWARNLVSAINVGFGGKDFSVSHTGRGYAVGGIFTDGGDANRYYNAPVNDQKNLANTIAYQMVNNFPPVYVDVKDINNQQNILAQTINRVNL